MGLELKPSDIAFRCNIVRVSDDDRLIDFTAGQIDEASVYEYLAGLQLAAPFEIHHDLSYRNVLIYRDSPLSVNNICLYEPHENVGYPIEDIMPRYKNETFKPLTEIMLSFAAQWFDVMALGSKQNACFSPDTL